MCWVLLGDRSVMVNSTRFGKCEDDAEINHFKMCNFYNCRQRSLFLSERLGSKENCRWQLIEYFFEIEAFVILASGCQGKDDQ